MATRASGRLTILGVLTVLLGGTPSPLAAQAEKLARFVELDSTGRAVRTRWLDECGSGLERRHSRHCDALWDSAGVYEALIRDLHYRNAAGIDVDSTRKAMGAIVTDCYIGLDKPTKESCEQMARVEYPVAMCIYDGFGSNSTGASDLRRMDSCSFKSGQASGIPTKNEAATARPASSRRYCLLGFFQEVQTPEWIERFVRIEPGGEYCLTLNTGTATFELSGSGRKWTYTHTYTKPIRDAHDPQKILSGTATRTEWILTPDSLHGTFYVHGDSLELTFQGDPWDWPDITSLVISPDGKTLSTHFRLTLPNRLHVNSTSRSSWKAVE